MSAKIAYLLAMKSLARALALIGAFALSAVPASKEGAAADGRDLTVVELYTSQGCSSCPPADALLGELAKHDDILALSFHVDYWDYIGWKDPFASPENTKRQREYATLLGRQYVYTPQMVVQGLTDASGARRDEVMYRIDAAKKMKRIPLTLKQDASELVVAIPAASVDEELAVFLVGFDRQHETAIKKGENAGRTLRYHHVVREFRRIGSWRGEAQEFRASMPAAAAAGGGSAVIVQSLKTGRIHGADLIRPRGSS